MQLSHSDGGLRTLDRIVRQYRSDVNLLGSPAPEDALVALEHHLQLRLPPGLRSFLARHNGAQLLRGGLRIRSTADVTFATDTARQVVLFADGPAHRWAFAPDAAGWVYGAWDDGRLRPLHGSFAGFLQGTLAVVESQVRGERDQAALRYEADSNDVHQLIAWGRRHLQDGRPEQAEAILRRLTVNDPSRVDGWQLLGDALAIHDRTAARQAWLAAFRRTVLPLPWPGAPLFGAEGLRSLERAFVDEEAWEDELTSFLDDRVGDVRSTSGADLVVAASRALAASRIRRGQRSAAREALAGLVTRSHGFTHAPVPWAAMVELATLEADLGNHDEAEALARRVVRGGEAPWTGRAVLLLASVATARQEPFAEDILRDAERAGLDDEDALRWRLLSAERSLRADQLPAARQHLEAAKQSARRLAMPRFTAAVRLVEGDVLRAEDRWDEATAAWSAGANLLPKGSDAELAYRFRSRLGDAALQDRDIREAGHHYAAAAQGFADHELIVREAWALLRLAQVRRMQGEEAAELLRGALSRFQHADLAAGVAAHDAVAGDPGLHLDWHLTRARDHARARYDAQRARPPYERADADRPERRLGAHRLAIAACSDDVVPHLARRMDAATRAIEAGRLAPKDESVLHYVGAADLLSGHRSWAAAETLLRHLMEQRVDGFPLAALQGAIARSPNAALVHGLLEHIELPKGKPGPALAAAAELLGLRKEVHAVGPLMALARRPHSPSVRRAAVAALGRIGDRRAIPVVLEALETPQLAEASALALLMLGDRRGLDFHGRALIERRQGLTGLPGEIVGRYGGPDHLLLLIAAADGEGPASLGALQGLGLLGDSRAVPTLLEALSRRDRQVVDVALGALELLTGHREEDEPGFRSRWHAWWETHAADFPEGRRFREGRVFGVEVLLERLEADDAWLRRTAYDELCIMTGEHLSFDADGPWRLQRAHVRAWRRWWVGAKERFVPGGWYLDGLRL
jgi:HEAT repeat protein